MLRNSPIQAVLMLPLIWITALPAHAAQTAIPRHLVRTNLLSYQTSSGEVLPVQSIPDWQNRRASILHAMQEVMGPLPGPEKRCPLEVRVEEEVDCGSY